MQVLLQSREDKTEHGEDAAPERVALDRLNADFERLRAEIRAFHKADLPASEIHRIQSGAREQASMALMMLDDCAMRAERGTLNAAHIANVEKWIAGARDWMQKRHTAYTTNVRRKFYLIKPRACQAAGKA